METERSEMTHEDDVITNLVTGWKTTFFLGLITLALGIVVVARPTLSLNVIAVLLGVTMIVSGIYHIVRALDGREHERVWRGIVGVLFILAGLVLLRHLHLSVALIGLFIGFTWVIQGVAALMESFAGERGQGRTGWTIFFGIISLIAGIVVISAPIASVAALTIFMGIWFIVMGAMEMFGSLFFRHAVRSAVRSMDVPGPRTATAAEAAPDTVSPTMAGGADTSPAPKTE
ncbi:MAG TPA: HdeD family acid-resistance protein [Trebonia sp.]|nr:HdeD family acid-resistance protein [Trebonia sp.]